MWVDDRYPRACAMSDQGEVLVKVEELARRWGLSLGAPFDGEGTSGAWVGPARRRDGTSAVLKLGGRHMEAEHEAAGLRFWNGEPTVRLLDADDELHAMLLERCEPGTALRAVPEEDQDAVIAGLLQRGWRLPLTPHPFRHLSVMLAHWSRETHEARARWPDAGLVLAGLELFETLPNSAATEVLLTTDLHAGNVLQAEREPWLVIDPKPFVGDPAYDATQHLFNCAARLRSDLEGTVRRFSDLLGVSYERAGLWLFARAAAEPRDDWEDTGALALARACARFA